MYKPVIMPCTQEQFETFKDRIPLPIVEIRGFEKFNFLSNYYFGQKEVTNYTSSDYEDRELIPYDPELFIECCGAEKKEEKEVIWAGKDMQYRYIGNDDWKDCPPYGIEYRLKPKASASDLDKEVKALLDKAKELGLSVTINFEEL